MRWPDGTSGADLEDCRTGRMGLPYSTSVSGHYFTGTIRNLYRCSSRQFDSRWVAWVGSEWENGFRGGVYSGLMGSCVPRYCPECKNDENEIVRAGEKLKESKRKSMAASKTTSSKRDWGKGMACVGRTKVCTIVPPDHFGPVPGVEVGTSWMFRMQVTNILLYNT
uniref:Uncharacterized protein n=1 Tax=Timema genevievae TaxID=629358 RepID=A0A7R9PL28_TIMGE|nr:unnamed protein product [Timema genevievae]